MLNDRYVFSQQIDSLPRYEFDRCVVRYQGHRQIRQEFQIIRDPGEPVTPQSLLLIAKADEHLKCLGPRREHASARAPVLLNGTQELQLSLIIIAFARRWIDEAATAAQIPCLGGAGGLGGRLTIDVLIR